MSRFSFKNLFNRRKKAGKAEDEAAAPCSPPSVPSTSPQPPSPPPPPPPPPPRIALRGPADFAIVRQDGAYRLTRLADRGSARSKGRRSRIIGSELTMVPENEDESRDDLFKEGTQDHSRSLYGAAPGPSPTSATNQFAGLERGSARANAHPAPGSPLDVFPETTIDGQAHRRQSCTSESLSASIQFAYLSDYAPESIFELDERSSGHALSSSTAFKVLSHDETCDAEGSVRATGTEQVKSENGMGLQTGLGDGSTHDLAFDYQINSAVERVASSSQYIDSELEREEKPDATTVETVANAETAAADRDPMSVQNTGSISQQSERDCTEIPDTVDCLQLHDHLFRPSNSKQEGSVDPAKRPSNIVEHPIATSAPPNIHYLPEEWRKEVNVKSAAESPVSAASSIYGHAEGLYHLSQGSVPWKIRPRSTNVLRGNLPDSKRVGSRLAARARARSGSMGGIMQAVHDAIHHGVSRRQLPPPRTSDIRSSNNLKNSSLQTSTRAGGFRASITGSSSSKTRANSAMGYTSKSAPGRILPDRLSFTYAQAPAPTLFETSSLFTSSPGHPELTIDDWPHIQQKGVSIKLPHGAQGVPRVLRHQVTGQLVVVKREALVRLVTPSHQYAYTLGREISSLVRLNHHPNIVKCFFHVQDPRLPLLRCMVLEFCEGGDLHNLITHWRVKLLMARTPRLFILHFISSMADAIAYMHHGLPPSNQQSSPVPVSPLPGWEPVIHSDIKPPNIFLRWGTTNEYHLPDVVLGDLGVSGTEASLVGNWSGTTGYEAFEIQRASILPPEFYADEHVMTPACDIYGFGATLYELVTGSQFSHPEYGGHANIAFEYARHGISDFVEQDNNIHTLTRFCLHELAPLRYSTLELYAYGQICKLQMSDLVGSARRIPSCFWPNGPPPLSHIDDDFSHSGDGESDADESDAGITTQPPSLASTIPPAGVSNDAEGPSALPLAELIPRALARARRARRRRSVVFCRCPHHSTDSLGLFDERSCLLGHSVSTLDPAEGRRQRRSSNDSCHG